MNDTKAPPTAKPRGPAPSPWNRHHITAVESSTEGYGDAESVSNLGRVFVLVLIIHIFLIGGIILYNCIHDRPSASVVETKPTPVKIAPKKDSAEAAKLAAAPAPKSVAKPILSDTYKVDDGDSIPSIAAALGVDAQELTKINNIQSSGDLYLGRQLKVPSQNVAPPAPVAKAEPVQAKVQQLNVAAKAPEHVEEKASRPAEKNDALAQLAIADSPPKAIAVKAPEKVQDDPPKPERKTEKIMGAAPEPAKPKVVEAKETPKLKPAAKPETTAKPLAKAKATPATRSYTVGVKDTFYSIAKKFGVTPEELMKLNNAKDASKLRDGSKIKVPAKE